MNRYLFPSFNLNFVNSDFIIFSVPIMYLLMFYLKFFLVINLNNIILL